MPNLVTEWIGNEPYSYFPLGDYVVRAPGVCGGRPTFKYSRIEITGALERLAAGEPVAEIERGYQGRVPLAALEEAVAIVNRLFLDSLPELAIAS